MKRESAKKLMLYLGSGITIATLTWGFLLTGSPSYNRMLSADRKREQDLEYLHYDIERYFREHEKLPEKLSDMKESHARYYYAPRQDPLTKEEYELKVTGTFSYELCAEFSLPSEKHEENFDYGYYYGNTHPHPAGRHCVSYEIPKGIRK